MVAVVGRLFQKWFPAQPNLSYTFIWDKTDAYNQKVYGLSEAVGEYCGAGQSTLRVKGKCSTSYSSSPAPPNINISENGTFLCFIVEEDKCFQ